MLFNLVTTRKGVEGKANQILQVLSPNVSTERWQSWCCSGKGWWKVGGRSESQDTWKSALVIQLEDFLGQEEQVRTVNSITTDNGSGMTKKQGLLEIAPGKGQSS